MISDFGRGKNEPRILKGILAALLLLVAGTAYPQFCPTCVQASSAPSSAVFNVSSATVRGQFTAGSLITPQFSVSTMTAGVFIGSGSAITELNASALASGTVSTSVVSGLYYGITGVGDLSTGTWEGNPVGTQYGGTGQNFVSVSSGSILYFSAPGVMSDLPSGQAGRQILQTEGESAPVWVSSPQISGANFYDVPLASLSGSTLPAGVSVGSGSITAVNGSAVLGDISGNAQNINGTLLQSQIATGTWSSSFPASSITVTGVSPGTYGGSQQSAQIVVGTDGRLTSATNYPITVAASSVTAGTFQSGVILPAAQVADGTLGSGVVASSLTANGVVGGSYGSAAVVPGYTVNNAGLLTNISTVAISIPASAINTNIPITSIGTGTFSTSQAASSITVTGVTPGSCGDSTDVCQVTFQTDGRASSATPVAITGASPTGSAGGALSGTYPNPGLAATGVTPATYGNAAYVPSFTVNAGGQITSASQIYLPSASTYTATTNFANLWSVAQTFPGLASTSSMTITGNLYDYSLSGTTLAFAGGNFGVGTSSPSYPLEVSGYGQFDSSAAVVGAGGLGVTYGVTAASATFSGSVNASTFTGTFIGTASIATYADTASSATYATTAATASTATYADTASSATYADTATVSEIVTAPINPGMIFDSSATDVIKNSVENSVLINGNECQNWYRTDAGPIVYSTATDAGCYDWKEANGGVAISTTNSFLSDTYFPYVFIYNDEYYMAYKATDNNIHLATSTDGANWGEANGGNAVFTATTTAGSWYYQLFNPGIAVVGNTWYLLQEGKTSSSNFEIGFSSAQFSGDINFNLNATASPVFSDLAGNPYLTYVPDRNALLAVYGDLESLTWELKASYAYLSSDLSQTASWISAPGFSLAISGIHQADPTMAFNTNPHNPVFSFGSILEWGYNQLDTYQVDSLSTLDQFFDTITRSSVGIGFPIQNSANAYDLNTGVMISTSGVVSGTGRIQATNSCASTTSCSATCPAGTFLVSGGCQDGSSIAVNGAPSGNSFSSGDWNCNSLSATTINVEALCDKLGP